MKDKILSGIMGLCVGDALGVPVEFNDRGTLIRKPVVNMRSHGTHNQPAGTWSDDTSMTLALLGSLSKGLDYHDIMENFMKWFTLGEYTPFGKVFDKGITTTKALMHYEQGVLPLECGGKSEYDNGNGSLMRILPIVFYLHSIYGNDFQEHEAAFEVIHNVSSLTHAHKRSQMACGIYISIAAMIMSETQLNKAIELGIIKAMEYYRKQSKFSTELEYFKRIEKRDFVDITTESIGSSGYVVDTLEAAIWCLLNTKDYKECVLKAVNLGEDTDTTAAVVGGLAGLYYGYESIPKEWLTTIIKRVYVEDLCNQLNNSFIGF
jgi:ADP-ribosylglycohydrolase